MNINSMNKSENMNFFIPRFERVDWKQVAALDIEKLRENLDFHQLQQNIKNIVYCHVDLEFPEADPNLRKLFKLSQIAIEFMNHCQEKTHLKLEECEKKLLTSEKNLETALQEKNELEKKLKSKKKQEKPNLINNEAKTSNTYFKCPYCPKAFLNGDFLKSHLHRRHGETAPAFQAVLSPGIFQTTNFQPSSQVEKNLEENIFVQQVEDLKRRLQTTEETLQNERQMVATLFEKMESCNVSLQSVMHEEIQKIHEKLVKSEAKKSDIPINENISYSIAIQTESTAEEKPDFIPEAESRTKNGVKPGEKEILTEEPIPAALPIETNTEKISIKSQKDIRPTEETNEVCVTDSPQLSRSQVRKLVEKALKNKLEELGLAGEATNGVPDSKFSEIMKKLKKERRQIGAKFKSYETLRAKFQQQISSRLGLEVPPKNKPRQIFSKIAMKFSSQNPGFSVKKSTEKSEGNVYEESPVRKIIPKQKEVKNVSTRGPVPVPRTKITKEEVSEGRSPFMARDGEDTGIQQQKHFRKEEAFEKKSPFMARNGKATEVSSLKPLRTDSFLEKSLVVAKQEEPPAAVSQRPIRKAAFEEKPLSLAKQEEAGNGANSKDTVKSLARNLETAFNSRTVAKLPSANAVNLIPETKPRVRASRDESDDSFSLSSLDNILASLKNPKMTTSTPKINRSVSWKEPLDTIAKSNGYESWDSS